MRVGMSESNIHNSLQGISEAFKRLKLDIVDAQEERYDEESQK